jgi:hypothetical protein
MKDDNMPLYVDLPTLTKAELLEILAPLRDDDRVYIRVSRKNAIGAIDAAERSGSPGEVHFCLTGPTVAETNGVSLCAHVGDQS